MTLPTSAALEREVEALLARCRPYVDATGAIHRIRAAQHAASTDRGRTTLGTQDVFDLDAFRRQRERQDDPPPEAA